MNIRQPAIALCGVAVGLTVWFAWSGTEPGEDSQFLGDTPAHGWGGHKPLDTVFTDGIVILENEGDEPITLLSIEQELNGLESVGAVVAGPQRPGTVQQLRRFPPNGKKVGQTVPLVGAVLPPGKQGSTMGMELLLGYRVAEKGRSTRESITLHYEVAGNEYERKIISTLAICTYEKPKCELEYGDDE